MKYFVHQASGVTVVSQLSWQMLDPFGESFFGHTQIPLLLKSGASLSARYKNGSETNIGVTNLAFEDTKDQGKGKGKGEPAKSRKALSFAVLVAQYKAIAGQSCIVFMRSSEDPDANAPGLVCAMIAGNVVLDDQFELADMEALYQNFADMCGRSSRHFEVHGDLSPPGVATAQFINLDNLLANAKSAAAVSPLRSDKALMVVVLLALAAILTFAGLAAWDWYRDRITAKVLAVKAHMQSPDYLYSQSVAALLAQPMWVMPTAMPVVISAVGSFPADLAGWRLLGLVCEENNCTAKWKSQGGTYADFQAAAAPGWGKLMLSQSQNDVHGDLQTLSHSLQLGVAGSLLPAVGQWASTDEFVIASGVHIQQLKEFGWSHQFGAAVQQALPAGVPPIAVAKHVLRINAMPWSVARQSWAQAKLVLPLFPAHAVLHRFEVHIDEKQADVTFSASGLVYVQK